MQNLQDDILAEYLAECGEMLEKLNANLSMLERESFDRSILRGFSRDIHTVKGSSQLFGFRNIGKLSHAMEECLERVQQLPKEDLVGLTDVLFEALDQISKTFTIVKTTKKEPEANSDYERTLIKLAQFGLPVKREKNSDSDPNSLPEEARDQDDEVEAEILADILKTENRSSTIVQGVRQAKEDFQGDSIRVNVDLLDGLMSLVGELVLIRNEVNQLAKDQGGDSILSIHQRLNAITSELQNNVMKTRMQPIGNLLSKFQRTVREISRDLGKSAILDLEGAETELDKALLETVRDPLIHIIRNAIDHGIEKPEERSKFGKPAQGLIRVSAIHENGFVTIEVQDDGRGIHHDKIRTKAFERGLLTPDLLSKLSDQETLQLIFLPGFSTADQVSDVSGRGLGMDVVKTNIERIGGTVQVRSKMGEGTQVVLKIPLTLAIISALLVRNNGRLYAIPQVKLLELLKVPRSEIGSSTRLDHLVESPVMRLRDKLLPLIDLHLVLGEKEAKDTFDDHLNVVVVHADHKLYGLTVDEIVDSIDIVVKPLPSIIKALGVFAGASILADGSTSFILDVNGIADKFHFFEGGEQRGLNLSAELGYRKKFVEEIEYILFDIGLKSPCAVPLCLVHRLEEFPASKVQQVGNRRAIKYGDAILPVISFSEMLGFQTAKGATEKSEIVVIVIRRGEHFLALEVEKITDILFSSADIEADLKERFGIVGSIVHEGQVILVVDVLAIFGKAIPSLHRTETQGLSKPKHNGTRERHHILLVEDGNFLRKQVSAVLKDAGYRVTAEADGQKALDRLENSKDDPFSIVISDIEMPVMDGFELIRRLRADVQWKQLPVVALTSRTSVADVDKGLKLGFNKYLEKMNPTQLIYEIDRIFGFVERY